MDSPSLPWMQRIGDLHFPVSLASIQHSLMLAGTKVTINAVTVEMFLLLPASRLQPSSQQLASTQTHFKMTYYNFLYQNSLHVMLQT
jgi:hypothetical protein